MVLVDQAEGAVSGQVSGDSLVRVEEVARKIVYERSAFRADQFSLKSNLLAHYHHTGPEILSQCDGAVDAFCDFAGTGGTFAGISRALKDHDDSQIGCYLIEPDGAAVLSGAKLVNGEHRIQGGGYSMSSLKMLDECSNRWLHSGKR